MDFFNVKTLTAKGSSMNSRNGWEKGVQTDKLSPLLISTCIFTCVNTCNADRLTRHFHIYNSRDIMYERFVYIFVLQIYVKTF